MDLADVVLFRSIVSTGSLSAAARKTGSTKMSVSRRLAALEEELGARLFHRTTRSISLTPEGEAFLPHAIALIEARDSAMESVSARATALSGVLKITAPNIIGVVTSANQFFRQIGSTMGVAIFGTLLTQNLNGKLQAFAVEHGLPALDLSKLRSLSVEAQVHSTAINVPEPVRILIADSVTHVIFLSLAVVLIALFATLMIPELPMRERPKTPPTEELKAEAHL